MSTISGLVGTYSSSSSFVDSVLGSTSSSSSGTSLVDYNMIKSGAYKKLMQAYYSQESSETNEDEEKSLTLAKSSAEDLATSTADVMKSGFDESDREDLLESLKSWVDDYNSVIESTDDINDTSTLRQVLWMTQMTEANEGLLSDIGITVNSDNTLSIDEDAFAEADLTTVNSLFDRNSSSSYGSKIVSYAASTYSAASNSLSSSSTASAYTSTGSYRSSSLDYSSLFDSLS
ncbi:MAG: hypothetical protein K5840_02785 [Eubacterium sp.]|nr:hypothetical protein [Eubacterium sp.]